MVSIFSPIFKNVLGILIFLGVLSVFSLDKSQHFSEFARSSFQKFLSLRSHFVRKTDEAPRSGEVAFYHPIKRGRYKSNKIYL